MAVRTQPLLELWSSSAALLQPHCISLSLCGLANVGIPAGLFQGMRNLCKMPPSSPALPSKHQESRAGIHRVCL